MRFARYLAILSTLIGMSFALTVPATAASDRPGRVETRAGTERIDSVSGPMRLSGVTSPAQLAATCAPGLFCGYGYDPAEGSYYQTNFVGCGWADIPWVGAGWWVNNLRGSDSVDRVAMYDDNGNKIYTTPHSPFTDSSANWTAVWEIQTCV